MGVVVEGAVPCEVYHALCRGEVQSGELGVSGCSRGVWGYIHIILYTTYARASDIEYANLISVANAATVALIVFA